MRRIVQNRRLDEILLITDELLQACRVEGDLLGEAKDNDTEDKAQKATDSTGHPMDHPSLVKDVTKSNSLRDVVDDDVKREKVLRIMALAVDEFGDILYPYTKKVERHPLVEHAHKGKGHGLLITDIYKEPEMWQISLDVPITLSQTTTRYLRTLGHEFVVGRVVEEWCALFYPEKLQWASMRVERTREQINAAKDRRVCMVRRRSSVY